MEVPAILTIVLFIIGVLVGMRVSIWAWKGNAKSYMGIDGFKVIHRDFYDYDITKRYQKFLQKKKEWDEL